MKENDTNRGESEGEVSEGESEDEGG